MNKQLLGIVATFLMLGTALSPAPMESGEIYFAITIQKDASIAISDLNTTGNLPLNFEPGINGLDEDEYALPTNNATESDPQWTITNIGNVPAYVYLSLNDSLPTGVTTEVGNQKEYNSSHYVPMSTSDSLYNVVGGGVTAPIQKGITENFWQRVAADITADGSDEAINLKLVITSSPTQI